MMMEMGDPQSQKAQVETEATDAPQATHPADGAAIPLEESAALPANTSSDAANLNDANTAHSSRSSTSASNNNNNNNDSHTDGNGDEHGQSNPVAQGSSSNNNNDGATPGHSRAPVAKDKRCIYCHMAFTSSALGRHYDQFLFKKKPDGVHNVEEICQMRSNITRRTARTSSAAAELAKQEPSFSNASVSDAGSVRSVRPNQGISSAAGPESLTSLGDHRQSVSRPNGVGAYQVYYNPPPFSSPVVNNNSPVPPKLLPTDSTSKTHNIRAVELALREVLDTVRAAATRVHARVLPFDFELHSQTFPSLCLHALQPPPTIFSTGPFPSDTSFSIEPPTAALKERVQSALREKVDKWKEEQLNSLRTPSPKTTPFNATKVNAEMDLIERQSRQHEEMILKHLDLALKHWETLSAEEQRVQWHLEIIRALAHEVNKRRNLEERLDRAYQESDRLRLQLERLTSLHFPREFAFFPPDMMPIPIAVARELGSDEKHQAVDPDSPRWDFDALVSKWKRVVLHDRAYGAVPPMPQSSMPASNALPALSSAASGVPPTSDPSPVYNNSSFAENGLGYSHNNNYPPSIHPGQPTQPEALGQYSTPDPAYKRRRVSNTAGVPVNNNSELLVTPQPPQHLQQQLTPLPSFQQATMGPPVNDMSTRNRKTPSNQQYRFKYSSGPNTPKASSLHSPPAQNSNLPPGTTNQFYSAPQPAPTPSMAPGPHALQPSPALPQGQNTQPAPPIYSNNSIPRPYSANPAEAQQTQSQAQLAPTPAPGPTAAPPPNNFADINFDGASPAAPPNGADDNTGPHNESEQIDRGSEREEISSLSHAPPMTHTIRKTDIAS